MKIRNKLFLGFGLYLFMAAIPGFFAYKELRTITLRLSLVEVADDITNIILEVRRYEKNFLLYKDKDNLGELKSYLISLKKDIDNIGAEITREIGTENHGMLKLTITDYERLIDGLAENFSSQERLVITVRSAGREIEKRLRGEDLRQFSALRRQEKNLMLFRDRESYDKFLKAFDSMNLDKYEGIDSYRILVGKLFELYKSEKGSVEDMRSKARSMQSFLEALSKKERAEISSILRMSVNLLLFALLAVIILGTVINIKLATGIAAPLRRLQRITRKISEGDFSETVEAVGEDEISSLGMSFNQMEERLKEALTSLEDTIRKLKEKQAELVEAEKLASIGVLAAGIAHEINNPLTSVLTFSNLMLEATPEGDPNREKLKMMAREAGKARDIVRQLLSFARETPLRPERMNVNVAIKGILDSFAAQGAFEGIELATSLQDGLPDIYADPLQIGQVISNILLNAIQAITPPGRIDVSTKAPEKFIEMIFSDTGRGIPEEHIGRIFDPFFTTKDISKGAGLGLAISYGIIKKHGGQIEVKSMAGKGSTFIVRLPRNG